LCGISESSAALIRSIGGRMPRCYDRVTIQVGKWGTATVATSSPGDPNGQAVAEFPKPTLYF
jgi:hypothetical protein